MDLTLDLAFANVVARHIDDYVQAEVLYYPVNANAPNGKPLPQLTIGVWLETEWRLKQLEPNAEALKTAQTEVQRVRALQPELYNAKAQREFKSRLGTWAQTIDEAVMKRTLSQAEYVAQVHNRFKLELLRNAVKPKGDQVLMLDAMDASLQKHFKFGQFLWEPELQKAAPKELYWWLWGKLIDRA
jgi:hypothetical protein